MISGDRVWWQRSGRRTQRVEATFMYGVGIVKKMARIRLKVMGSEYLKTVPIETLSPIINHEWPTAPDNKKTN